jgi:isopentenyldiphosphate isomerase
VSADELLEVYDASGQPTGIAKRRSAIHRDGDWHLAFFCWIVTSDERVLLQRRAPDKDVWPGRLDASAAGHVRFGEGIAGALREIEEELGVPPPPLEALEYVGRFRHESVHGQGTSRIVCREHEEVFVWRSDRPIEEYRPGPEVSELVFVPLAELASLGDALVPHDTSALASIARRQLP